MWFVGLGEFGFVWSVWGCVGKHGEGEVEWSVGYEDEDVGARRGLEKKMNMGWRGIIGAGVKRE